MLRKHYRLGQDFVILTRQADSRLALMAPHGGGIEPGTVDIADAIAGSDFTFYAFKGIRKSGNRVLHLKSNRFDEPMGVAVAARAEIVMTIHGCQGREQAILVGGRRSPLKENICRYLGQAGFQARICTTKGLRGVDPENICNRFSTQGGIQLELTRGLREAMFHHLERRSLRGKTLFFFSFIKAVRQPLLEHMEALEP